MLGLVKSYILDVWELGSMAIVSDALLRGRLSMVVCLTLLRVIY